MSSPAAWRCCAADGPDNTLGFIPESGRAMKRIALLFLAVEACDASPAAERYGFIARLGVEITTPSEPSSERCATLSPMSPEANAETSGGLLLSLCSRVKTARCFRSSSIESLLPIARNSELTALSLAADQPLGRSTGREQRGSSSILGRYSHLIDPTDTLTWVSLGSVEMTSCR